MSLKRRETSETAFNEILKSKHARYVDGGVLVSRALVAGDFLPSGTVLGQVTEEDHDEEGKYGPVTRGKVETITQATKTITMDDPAELWNFRVGDVLEVLNASGDVIVPEDTDDLEIAAVDEVEGKIVVKALTADSGVLAGVYVQKADGTSKAKVVCTHSIEFDDDEDKFVGGITHGTVHKERLPNYDDFVARDLPLVSFE